MLLQTFKNEEHFQRLSPALYFLVESLPGVCTVICTGLTTFQARSSTFELDQHTNFSPRVLNLKKVRRGRSSRKRRKSIHIYFTCFNTHFCFWMIFCRFVSQAHFSAKYVISVCKRVKLPKFQKELQMDESHSLFEHF